MRIVLKAVEDILALDTSYIAFSLVRDYAVPCVKSSVTKLIHHN